MTIAFVGAGTAVRSATSPQTFTLPTGVQANDLIIVEVMVYDTPPGTISSPNYIGRDIVTSTLVTPNETTVLLYKFAATSEANPVISYSGHPANGWGGQVYVWRGVDTTTPFDVSDIVGANTGTGIGTYTPTGLTTVTGGAVAVSLVTIGANTAAPLLGTSQSFVVEGTAAITGTPTEPIVMATADKTVATPGPVTFPTWSQGAFPSSWAFISYALRPAGATGGGGGGGGGTTAQTSHDGIGALQVVTTNPSTPVATGRYSITASHSYLVNGYVISTSTADTCVVGLQWLDANGLFISNSVSATQTVPAGSFGNVTFTATAPSNAGFVVLFLTFTGVKTYIIDTDSILDQGAGTGGGGTGGGSGGGGGGGSTSASTQATAIYDSFGTTNPDTGFVAGLRTDLPSGAILFDADHQWGKHEYPIFITSNNDWQTGARAGGTGPWLPSQNNANTPNPNGCAGPWGQVMDAVTSPGSSTTTSNNSGVRVQIQTFTTWVVQAASMPASSAVWTKWMTAGSIGGALYNNAFAGVSNAFGDIRTESSGGWSFAYQPGFINHFWDGVWPRPGWPPPGSLAGIHVRFQARLITDSGVNLNNVFMTCSVGCDFYPTPTNVSNGQPIIGMMESRMKRITSNWQWFTGTGLAQSAIQNNPVPVFGS